MKEIEAPLDGRSALRRNIMKRNLLALVMTVVCGMMMHAAKSPETLRAEEALQAFAGSVSLDKNATAVIITDLKTGKTVIDMNGGTPLVPASVMKAVTTASLLDEAGASKRYETRVFTEGKVHDGVLEGNLVIEGSGDPSLNFKCEEEVPDICKEIASAFRKAGIRRISGKVKIEEEVFCGPAVPPSWASGDLSQSYGTGCHGFNFEGNRSGKAAVKNPAEVFKIRLNGALGREGISVDGGEEPTGKRRLLLTHKSAPYDDIMRSCMMRSDNLYAEALQRTFSIARGKEGSTEAAAEEVTKYWHHKKLPMEGVKIVDGSGLSRSNRLTARFLNEVLIKMADNVDYAAFFPLAGQEGTLKNFLANTPLDSYVALKTGSMNGIQSYAGYKLDEDFAPTHTIVVISNNLKNRAGMRKALSDMLLTIFQDPH